MKHAFNLLILALFVNNTMMPSAESTKPTPSHAEIKRLIFNWKDSTQEQKQLLARHANTYFENGDSLETPLGMALNKKESHFLECIHFLLKNGACTQAPVFVRGRGELLNPFMVFFDDPYRMSGTNHTLYEISDAIKLILRHHDTPSFCVADEFIKPEWRGYQNPDALAWVQTRQKWFKDHPEEMAYYERKLLAKIEPLLKEHLLQQRQWSPDRRAWCIAVVRGIFNSSK